jgi:hypothetical protein
MTECNLKNEVCGGRCTGYQGQSVWKEIHEIHKKIDCQSCSEDAKEMFIGIHDHVNTRLGKKPHDIKTYKKFVDDINCSFKACIDSGRCQV